MTTNTKTLLQNAARAAGIEIQPFQLSGWIIISGEDMGKKWNPLTDDLDSRHLQVKLKISLYWIKEMKLWVGCIWSEDKYYWIEHHHTDPSMAVLLVAAAIGEAMEGV